MPMSNPLGPWRLAALCLVVASLPACRSRRPAPGAGDQAAAGSVRGQVTSANDRPLVGARVRLERETSAGPVQAASARAGEGGAFLLARVPAGRYLLRAEERGYAAASVPLEVRPGESVGASLRLEPEQLLEGLVEDSRAKPLPDAMVLAWPAGGGRVSGLEPSEGSMPPAMGAAGRSPPAPTRAQVVETRSDADGRFTLAGLPRGAWTILAEAPGFGTLQLDRVEVPARRLVLRLEGEARTLGGLVLGPEGEAPAGARVVLGSPSLRATRTTTTGEKGTFLFGGIGLGRYSLRAARDRLVSLPASQLIDEATGWLPPFRLMLAPGALAEGRVTDDRGRPLAGAAVEVLAIPSDDLPESGRTDGTGRFALGPLPPGRYQIVARHPDHVLLDPPELRLRAEAATPVELRMARAARLSGRVVDGKGAPIAGASVGTVGLVTGGDELMVFAGALPLAAEAAGLPAHTLLRQGRVRTTTTDASGAFLLDETPPGRIRLEISHPETLPFRREPLLVGPGETRALGDLALASGVVLAGRALDDRDQPIEGARIAAWPGRAAAAGSARTLQVLTDRDGRFSFRVPAGEYSVSAVAPEHAPQTLFGLRAAAAAPPAPVEIRMPRAQGTLEGQVREAAGRPVGRASLVVLSPPAGLDAAPGTAVAPRPETAAVVNPPTLPLASALSDPGGRFRIPGVPRGPLVLEVRHPDWPPAAQIVQAGNRIAITLAPPAGIEGEVRDAATGSFVSGYRLEAEGPEGRAADRARVEGAGFSIAGLKPGRWRLRVLAPGYAPWERVVDLPPAPKKEGISLRGLRVDLTRGADAGVR